jgi:hypothetical protein
MRQSPTRTSITPTETETETENEKEPPRRLIPRESKMFIFSPFIFEVSCPDFESHPSTEKYGSFLACDCALLE